jgi:hypothetical protein
MVLVGSAHPTKLFANADSSPPISKIEADRNIDRDRQPESLFFEDKLCSQQTTHTTKDDLLP